MLTINFVDQKEIWKEQINKIFIEWRGSTRRTISQFAEEVCEVSQPVVSGWLNYGSIPTARNIRSLGKKYPIVYEILGLKNPDELPVDEFLALVPADFRAKVLEARAEYSSELASKGIETDSPEARRIVIEAFEKRGVKVNVTD